jgi:cob(I)alamin adenosyltransferase
MFLLQVQHILFVAESNLAADKPEHLEKLPKVSESEIELLEREIDHMNLDLPELRSFILPGGMLLFPIVMLPVQFVAEPNV